MANKYSRIKSFEDYEVVLVVGYVDEGMCSVFVRNKITKDDVAQFGTMDIKSGYWLLDKLGGKVNE
jgi:hypothetical protein